MYVDWAFVVAMGRHRHRVERLGHRPTEAPRGRRQANWPDHYILWFSLPHFWFHHKRLGDYSTVVTSMSTTLKKSFPYLTRVPKKALDEVRLTFA